MKEEKCENCQGSGYKSAAENMPPDTPSILMPCGTWPCPVCHGTGKVKQMENEDWKKIIAEVKK